MTTMHQKMRRFLLGTVAALMSLTASAQIHGTIHHDGNEREYFLYLPENPAPGHPLAFMLHGYGGQAEGYFPEFIEAATKEGFAVCNPQGLKDPGKGKTGWNVGYPPQLGWEVDDVSFIGDLLEALRDEYGFGDAFFSGMSNGGDLSYIIAHQEPTMFKAIASLAGLQMVWAYKSMSLSTPVNFIEVHGTADHTSEWAGDPTNKGGWGEYISVPLAVQNIAVNARCTHEVCDTLARVSPESRLVVRHSYEGGATEVKLYEVIGGKHSRHVADADTPRLIVDFFKSHLSKQ